MKGFYVFSKIFIVVPFTLKSLIYFELIFPEFMRFSSRPNCSSNICWISSLNYFCTFVKNQLNRFVCAYSRFFILFYSLMCLCLCQYHTVVTGAIIIINRVILPALFFFVKLVTVILGSVSFHIETTECPCIQKNLQNFDGKCFKITVNFRTDIFTIQVFPCTNAVCLFQSF